MNNVRSRIRSTLSLLPWVAVGFSAGLLNGLLGAAGGIVLVTLLPFLSPPAGSGLSRGALTNSRDLLVTSLCVMLPVTALSAILYWLGGKTTDLRLAAVILLPAALGGLVGAYLLGRLPRSLLKRLFGLLVAISGIRMLLG